MSYSAANMLKVAGLCSLVLAGCAAGASISDGRFKTVSFDELIDNPARHDGRKVALLARPLLTVDSSGILSPDADPSVGWICIRSFDSTSDRIDRIDNPTTVMAFGIFGVTAEEEPRLQEMKVGDEVHLIVTSGCRSRFSLHDVILRAQPE